MYSWVWDEDYDGDCANWDFEKKEYFEETGKYFDEDYYDEDYYDEDYYDEDDY